MHSANEQHCELCIPRRPSLRISQSCSGMQVEQRVLGTGRGSSLHHSLWHLPMTGSALPKATFSLLFLTLNPPSHPHSRHKQCRYSRLQALRCSPPTHGSSEMLTSMGQTSSALQSWYPPLLSQGFFFHAGKARASSSLQPGVEQKQEAPRLWVH